MAEAERHAPQCRGAAPFNAAAVLLGGFSQLSPTLAQTFVRNRHSTQRCDANGIAGNARSFQRGDYTAIFAWIGWPDGSVL